MALLGVEAGPLLQPASPSLGTGSQNLAVRLALAPGAFFDTEASMGSPFWHDYSRFDAIDAVRRHEDTGRSARAGYYASYFGVAIDPAIFPAFLTDLTGQVEGDTLPANWHADLAEFGAAMRAVDLASGTFTVAELGCGWGCWLNIAGAAARRAGLAVRLIGVEGDSHHVQLACQSLKTNGFDDDKFTIHYGIAAATSGSAFFPRQKNAEEEGSSWGLAPIFAVSEAESAAVEATGRYDRLPIIALDDLVGPEDRIDLLHIDIQGGEADLIDGALPFLDKHVGFVLIGTHSRQIEGRLFETLTNAGWRLEIERPMTLHTLNDIPQVQVDGVQGWRNLRLLPL